MKRIVIIYLTLIVFITGCAVEYQVPDLGGLYSRVASSSDLDKNPVIVIPGILGSKLVDEESGRVVWGAFEGTYADPEEPDGARLVALPIREGAKLSELKDDVYPDTVLDRVRVRIFGLSRVLNAYINILSALGVGGYRDETLGTRGQVNYGKDHFTYFQFAYDWRRDNVENARLLHEFILEKRAYIREEYKKRYGIENYEPKFDIVAHSMGGLVTRYYLLYGGADLPEDGSMPEVTWAGAEYVDKAVLVGTPNAGSVHAIVEMIEGREIAPLLLPTYQPAVIGTMPSVYQLFPRTRHKALRDENGAALDIMDPELWIKMGWGLANPKQDKVLSYILPDVSDPEKRRAIAIDHMRKSLKRAEQFHRAIDAPTELPEGLKIYLVAGDAVPTDAVLTVKSTGEIMVSEKAPGDGTVIRSSALLDERIGQDEWTPNLVTPIEWSHVTFLFSDHLGITKDPSFTDNVLFLLLEKPKT